LIAVLAQKKKGLCMTNRNKPTPPFSSGHFLARLVIILLAFCILVDLIAVALGYSQVALLSKALSGQTITEVDATANDMRQQTIAILQLAAYLITGIFFLMWIYRAQRNLPALGIRRPRYSPAWAVGWFFVPILNLFRPYDIVKELWKETNPDVGISDTFLKQYSSTTKPYSSKSMLIGLWWGFWIASVIVARAASRLTSESSGINEVITGTWVSMASDALSIVGTVFAILIVKEIDARQEEKHRRLTVDGTLGDDRALGTGL
jgi:uncharacterized protein DUF4328